ncbi:membrane protein [Ornithinimicrobium tianjinense]|uniref:Membrane protein n=2 Tax=Ornithinimicrobium tianjinense TaxID=1195761 RepID=A0A917BDM9_9MICO|nr:membrane protein [Ornithinimicrobium tianjinense]
MEVEGMPPARLREPAHRVSPRAVRYWTVNALLGNVLAWAVMFVIAWFLPEGRWWSTTLVWLFVVAMLANVVEVVVEPVVRYRRTRWEVRDGRVFVQTGWLSRDQRIAPLSRVQTVDTHRGAVMRLYRLANITVTTASAAGPITIPCLDTDLAEAVTAELARITGQTRGDAT